MHAYLRFKGTPAAGRPDGPIQITPGTKTCPWGPRADGANPVAPTPAAAPVVSSRARQVLSVGHRNEGELLPERIRSSPRFCVAHAHDYRELWKLAEGSTFDAVLFEDSLNSFELEEAARLVRRRWPSAAIVLIRPGEITLEDSLYDVRLRPPADPETLMAFLSGQPVSAKGGPGRRWHVAHALGR